MWSEIDSTIRGLPKLEIPAFPGSGGKDSGQSLNLESSLSKQSNGNIRTEYLNHGNKRPNPIQPSSTLLNNDGVIPNAQPSKHITFNHDGGRSHEELSIKANPTSGGTLTKGCKPSLHKHAENQKEVHQYRSSEKKELIVFYLAGVAMGICKRKAEPSMLDMVLREKLDEITLVTTKRNVQ
ncbi:hypothetical protein Cgig2_027352 [Carnegiea gigantea]|uniref:Uncharacterized protein n=1 Tax=Carnegiea gigantea TaxID=171969 RepID=A0A9Q1K7Z8_9CARY|nr:hypothetical protein Cgig2_027352 [Carnegiea gigantea]